MKLKAAKRSHKIAGVLGLLDNDIPLVKEQEKRS